MLCQKLFFLPVLSIASSMEIGIWLPNNWLEIFMYIF